MLLAWAVFPFRHVHRTNTSTDMHALHALQTLNLPKVQQRSTIVNATVVIMGFSHLTVRTTSVLHAFLTRMGVATAATNATIARQTHSARTGQQAKPTARDAWQISMQVP